MKKAFQVPALIEKVSTRADRSIHIEVSTQELSDEDAATLFGFRSKLGYMLFAEAEISPEQAQTPEYVPEFKGDKTPAQRLRAVMYRLWEQQGKQGSSEQFYRERMEEIIEHFKKKLD